MPSWTPMPKMVISADADDQAMLAPMVLLPCGTRTCLSASAQYLRGAVR